MVFLYGRQRRCIIDRQTLHGDERRWLTVSGQIKIGAIVSQKCLYDKD